MIKPEEILDLQDLIRIDRATKQVMMSSEAKFYPEAVVYNLQNKPDKIRIGKNSHIRGELVLFASSGEIEIKENVYVGSSSIIRSQERVVIGNNVLIAHNCTIIDTDSHEVNHLKRANDFIEMVTKGHSTTKGTIKTAPIVIEDYVWISYNVSILKGVTIGKGAIVAAGSVVTKDVLPFTLVAGNPARFIKDIENSIT